MTPQETINIIEDVTWQDNGRHYEEIVPAREIAISALEKQIKKKPKEIIKSEVGIKYNCPNCDKTFMCIDINNIQWGHISKFCEICGQALDWSDSE